MVAFPKHLCRIVNDNTCRGFSRLHRRPARRHAAGPSDPHSPTTCFRSTGSIARGYRLGSRHKDELRPVALVNHCRTCRRRYERCPSPGPIQGLWYRCFRRAGMQYWNHHPSGHRRFRSRTHRVNRRCQSHRWSVRWRQAAITSSSRCRATHTTSCGACRTCCVMPSRTATRQPSSIGHSRPCWCSWSERSSPRLTARAPVDRLEAIPGAYLRP